MISDSRARLLIVWGAPVFLAGEALIVFGLREHQALRVSLSNGLLVLCNLAVVAALLWARRRSGPLDRKARLGWAILAASRLLLVASDATWMTFDLQSQSAFSSASTSLLAGVHYLAFVAGILLLAGAWATRWDRIRLALDTAITLVLVGVGFWAFPGLLPAKEGAFADASARAAGVVAALSLLCVLSWVLARTRVPEFRRTLVLLWAALGVSLAGDLLLITRHAAGRYVPSDWLDLLYAGSYLLVGLAAAVHATRSQRSLAAGPRESRLAVPLQYAWVTLLYALLVTYPARDMALPFHALAVAVGAVIGLTFARHLVTSSENASLFAAAQREIEERSQAETEQRRLVDQQRLLLLSARQITSSLDLNQVLRNIARSAHLIVQCDTCAIYLFDRQAGVLKPLVCLDPLYEAETMATPLDVTRSLTGQAILRGHVVVFNDAGRNPLGHHTPGTPVDEARRVMAAPFIVLGETLGAIYFSRTSADFAPADEALAETLAMHAAAAMMNARNHATLQHEVRQRIAAQELLIELNEALESRVRERTAALEAEIGERRHAEEQATAALHEREVLLREIHHRVKNNLQVVSSLLLLQSARVADPVSLAILKDGQNRVRAMALIHEKLYGSGNLASIDFGGYLRDLTAFLFQSYGTGQNGIALSVEVEPVHLDIDSAIPCGLIVNELVSNCLKHGFPAGRQGQVTVGCHRSADGRVLLEVGDDGVGFPDGVDFRHSSSLGLQLVNTLAAQIDGEVELEREPHTRFRISFPAGG